MLCAIWYHLYKLKNMKTPMGECYRLKPATESCSLEVTLLHELFPCILNSTNNTKITQNATYCPNNS